jgi:hypothetical protein
MNIFLSKFPNNFQKCVIKTATVGIHHSVSLFGIESEADGKRVYDIRGLMVEYFLLSIKEMKTKAVVLQLSLDILFETGMTETTKLRADVADLLVGVVPLQPVVYYIWGLCSHRSHYFIVLLGVRVMITTLSLPKKGSTC